MVNKFKNKRFLIFDFDGTLADTSPLHKKAFSKVLDPIGVKFDYSEIAGLKTNDAIRKCLEGNNKVFYDKDIDILSISKQKYVRRMIEQSLLPLPGVEDLLLWAKTRFQLGIVTSGSRATVNTSLKKLGYVGLFNPLICADDVRHSKPDPSGFLLAVKLSGNNVSDCLIFEDSDSGMLAAKYSGITAIDVREQSFSSLIPLLKQMNFPEVQ